MDLPKTTLFMLSSLDGKISTGSTDNLDVDTDFPTIPGIKEGLYQYYDIEKTTDLCSLNSGKVQAKIGANKPKKDIAKLPVDFVIIDNHPHLNKTGVQNFLKKSRRLFIVTTNKKHPAFLQTDATNLEIVYCKKKIDFTDLFCRLKKDFGIKRITVQTGGTLNAVLLREKLIDRISIVVAPVLIGGKNTASLIDGPSLTSVRELSHIKALELVSIKKLKHSYIHLTYSIIK
ncbi:MAG: deaminase [Candidatus Magasanikbacteria bacterium CG11_big_fil_rev_8_21_14_0_20_43_7]|uniref:Deaminase n=1 Tax=Candidatus Magasanikbacteria bacterium CG11_big_fil_rev_8_21_14_0_20_43_7 TaxID=1974654 RepID=A0A2H0N5V2_9BACT|nr:MAG: deaminase [Candidatus Magasanikbacteria bacterium CG11_big_fil_rev_8_21_14_0_20_43_7]